MTSKYPEIEKIMNDNTDLVLNGEQTAEEALAIMHEQVDALLQS